MISALTSMRFMSCPKSLGLTVREDPVVEVSSPDPLGGPEDGGGIGGAGTRLMFELTTD